jgi:hypothetical protein
VLVVMKQNAAAAEASHLPLRRWMEQQIELWTAGGKATGWQVGRCRHVYISELFSIQRYNQVVMDFLPPSDVGNFPPKLV